MKISDTTLIWLLWVDKVKELSPELKEMYDNDPKFIGDIYWDNFYKQGFSPEQFVEASKSWGDISDSNNLTTKEGN